MFAFLDSLRQELLEEKSPVKLTNVYPYLMDTAMFKGVRGWAQIFVPPLTKEYVSERTYQAIMAEEWDAYVPFWTYWASIALLCLPGHRVRYLALKLGMGDAMAKLKN